jgi:hypothetical protein
MKLAEVRLKSDCRLPEFHSVHLTDAQYDMTFDAGLVRITRREDAKTRLIALGNCISITPAEDSKAAKKAA